MTDREHWKKMFQIIQAFVKGEVVQFNSYGEWEDLDPNKIIGFNAPPNKYRIKPGPKYRAFETADECWQEMLRHEPFGWLHNKKTNSFVSAKVIGLKSPDEEGVDGVAYSIVFEKYTFADGTPFGFKEE